MSRGRAWPSDGWQQDGWPHERDENGTCRNCGASKREYHYRLKPAAEYDPYTDPVGLALVKAIHDRKAGLQ
jgi:hypothetical protein